MTRSTSSKILLLFFLTPFLFCLHVSASDHVSKDRFIFENFKTKEALQNKLHDLFPIETHLPSSGELQHIDQALVEQGGAFRSPNLTGNFEAGVYKRGDSSSRNYVIYFKPVPSSKSNGWKKTSKGWVIIAVYMGGGGMDLDKNKDKLVRLKDHRLLELSVLSSPNDEENNEHILLAKKLLQYKEYLNPPIRFDENEWNELFEIHKKSHCLKKLDDTCLLNEAIGLLSKNTIRPRLSHLRTLTDVAVQSANTNAAVRLLKIWPSDEDIQKHEESIPKAPTSSNHEIKQVIESFRLPYIKLLFVAGRYAEGKKALIDYQTEKKTGMDDGALSILVKKSDLDNAYDLAQEVHDWKREARDSNEGTTAIMHCQNYDAFTSKVYAMGELAKAYIQKAEFGKARNIIDLVHGYWINASYGQRTFCYSGYAHHSYLEAMTSLIEAYALNGNIQKASELLNELLTVLIEKTEAVTVGNKGSLERVAEISVQRGIPYDSERLLTFIVQNDKMEFNAYTYRNYDPIAYIYGLAGEYDKAIKRTNNYKVNKDASMLDDFASIFTLEPSAENEYKLNTYLWIAQKLAKREDKKGALFFLKEVELYLGSRKERYDKHVNKLKDYLTKVEILLAINEREEAKKSFYEFLALYSKTPKSEYRTGTATTGFYGRIAVLYTEFETIQNVLKWSENLPTMYGNWTYAHMSALLFEQNRLEEFELLKPIFAKNITLEKFTGLDDQSLKMMEAYGYDHYLDFIHLIQSNGKSEDKYFDYKPYTLLKQPFVKQLISHDVPFTILKKSWPQYLEQCKTIEHRSLKIGHDRYRKLNAAEILSACYISVVAGKHWQERYGDRLD